jgi:2-polyprenyl-3-methyl-5-hydroxy-6-metoxy-1,4-benzoquinol methylase
MLPFKCPLCLSTRQKTLYDLQGLSRPNVIPGLIVQCLDCALVFKVTNASHRIADAYGESYAEGEGIAAYMTSEATRAFFREVIRGLNVKRGRLLDIGTGLGAFVEEAQALGYQAQGIDLCAPLVTKAQARGLDVRLKAAEELEDSSERGVFDVVTMMDIIEHVPDPVGLLSAARRLMKEKSELIVYTPNHRAAVVLLAKVLNSLGADFAIKEIFGGNHLTFFDDRTLPVALDKAGFSLREVKHSPYDPSRPGQPISLVSLATVALVEQAGRPFGRMFRMLTYANPKLPQRHDPV